MVAYWNFVIGNKKGELFSEWIDSYYARDILELFNVRNRIGIPEVNEFAFLKSGGHTG